MVNQGKAQVIGWEGQYGLTRFNVWITIIIIIVLKLDLRVDPRQGSDDELRGSTRQIGFGFITRLL